jgi:rod shape-determining protein MreD
VIYFALNNGEMHGMITGTFAGLIQDSFTLTVLGINGFSKTILGFLIGLTGKTIEVRQLIVIFPIIFLGVFLEGLINALLYLLTGLEPLKLNSKILFLQPFLTAIIGSLIFKLIFRIREKWQK